MATNSSFRPLQPKKPIEGIQANDLLELGIPVIEHEDASKGLVGILIGQDRVLWFRLSTARLLDGPTSAAVIRREARRVAPAARVAQALRAYVPEQRDMSNVKFEQTSAVDAQAEEPVEAPTEEQKKSSLVVVNEDGVGEFVTPEPLEPLEEPAQDTAQDTAPLQRTEEVEPTQVSDVPIEPPAEPPLEGISGGSDSTVRVFDWGPRIIGSDDDMPEPLPNYMGTGLIGRDATEKMEGR